MNKVLALTLFLPIFSFGQQLPIVEFDFFMESVGEDVDSVVVDVIITDYSPDTVFAYVINEVSSNALIGTDFYMESPYELIFPPMSIAPQQVVIHIEDDGDIEGAEAIMLAIESVFGDAVTGTEAEHVIWIDDNDVCTVAFEMEDTLVCTDASPIPLIGEPAGGEFSGPGVIGSTFYPQLCDPGDHQIVYMVDEAACNDSASVMVEVEVCAGLEEFEQSDLKIYPNPAHDQLNLWSDSGFEKRTSLSIYDGTGKQVFTTALKIRGTQATIPLNGISPGIYSLRVSDHNNLKILQLIVR